MQNNIQQIQMENTQRLHVLYVNHSDWLLGAAYNITKNRDVAEDLVQELYLYLAEKGNPSIWFKDSFNLLYLHSFLKTRFLNLIKQNKRVEGLQEGWDTIDEEYDCEFDIRLQKAYTDIQAELERLQRTKQWSSARLAELYLFSDKTLEGLSKEIGISKSTSFLHVKKMRKHLKENIANPFH
jgi:DNA-directed RNA polymerase specialized sigma24 family protein